MARLWTLERGEVRVVNALPRAPLPQSGNWLEKGMQSRTPRLPAERSVLISKKSGRVRFMKF